MDYNELSRLYLDLIGLNIPSRLGGDRNALNTTKGILRIVSNNYAPRRFRSIKLGEDGRQIEDHAVPVSLVHNRLLSGAYSDPTQLVTDLEKYLFTCTITQAEDASLNAYGLQRNMPEGWQWGSDDALARYEAVGIKLLEV